MQRFVPQTQERLDEVDTHSSANPHDSVLPKLAALTSSVEEARTHLKHAHDDVTQHFERLGVDYYKVASLELERKVSVEIPNIHFPVQCVHVHLSL